MAVGRDRLARGGPEERERVAPWDSMTMIGTTSCSPAAIRGGSTSGQTSEVEKKTSEVKDQMDEEAAKGCGFLLAAALLGPLLTTLAVFANRVLGVL